MFCSNTKTQSTNHHKVQTASHDMFLGGTEGLFLETDTQTNWQTVLPDEVPPVLLEDIMMIWLV